MADKQSEAVVNLRSMREQSRLGGGLKAQEAIRVSGRGTARDLSLIHI